MAFWVSPYHVHLGQRVRAVEVLAEEGEAPDGGVQRELALLALAHGGPAPHRHALDGVAQVAFERQPLKPGIDVQGGGFQTSRFQAMCQTGFNLDRPSSAVVPSMKSNSPTQNASRYVDITGVVSNVTVLVFAAASLVTDFSGMLLSATV
jgi:hypothetical protein